MSSGSKGSSKTTQTAEPWKVQVPYLKDIFKDAQALYRSNLPSYYPNSTIAPFAPETLLAQQAQAARASYGSPLNAATNAELQRTLSGAYLGRGNPYFSKMARRIGEELTPQVNSQFTMAGRYGSGAHTGVLAHTLGNQIGALAYQNYADERGNQMRAAAMAPQQSLLDYVDIDRLAAVGAQRERMAQDLINADIARFNFAQSLPFSKLAQYQDFVNGQYGETRTTTQPNQRGFGMLSGAQTGAQIGGAFGAPGTAIGAGLGALLGLF